jgi:hypothetical protein
MNRILCTVCLGWLILSTTGGMTAEGTPGITETPAAVASVIPGNNVSAYAVFTSAVEQTMLVVPDDKHFVLTDIIGMASIEIREGDVTKIKVQLGCSPDKNAIYSPPVSLRSGIVFGPGTKVVVHPYPVGIGLDSSYGYVTLSGFYY